MSEQAVQAACVDGCAWIFHHPAHSPIWVPTCALCGRIDGENIARQVTDWAAQAHAAEVAALRKELEEAHRRIVEQGFEIGRLIGDRERVASATEAIEELEKDLAAVRAELDEATEGMRARLADHYLAQIVCDHERGLDNPICACSVVHLGWHPSVGAAVAAWIDHALALPAPAAGDTPKDGELS